MIRIFIIVTALLACLSAKTQTDTEITLYKTENGFLSFESDAPLELIVAESNSLRGLVDPQKRTFAVQVQTKTLNGFNSPLQEEHFYENYIESGKFPIASFSGKLIEKIDFESREIQMIRAKGTLEIHGKKMERIIKCELLASPDSFIIKSSFIVRLEDHNISIPKLVYQKIAEEIKIHVEAQFIKDPRKK